MLLNDFVDYLCNESHDLHQLTDIPGSIGGAIYGNTGAYEKEIKDILELATVIDK